MVVFFISKMTYKSTQEYLKLNKVCVKWCEQIRIHLQNRPIYYIRDMNQQSS